MVWLKRYLIKKFDTDIFTLYHEGGLKDGTNLNRTWMDGAMGRCDGGVNFRVAQGRVRAWFSVRKNSFINRLSRK